MNHDRKNPDNTTHSDEQALAEALGSAIGRRVGASASRPPVSSIAERAAARAKARNTRHAITGIAASVALAASGFVAWNTLDDNQPTEVISAEQPEASSNSAPDAPSALVGQESASSADPPTPQSLSSGPALEWEALDDSGLAFAYDLNSTGDGRATALVSSPDGNKLLVTEDGRTWTPLSVPDDVGFSSVEITGGRWLLSGWRFDGVSTQDVVLYSDNDGADWKGIELPAADPSEQTNLTATVINGSDIVVAVLAEDRVDVKSVIVARGLASDESEIAGWTLVEGETVSFTRDSNSPTESFALTPEEMDQVFGQNHVVRLYHSQDGPAQLTAEYPGYAVSGRTTADGFSFVLYSDEGEFLLTSADGRVWDRSPLKESLAPHTATSDGFLWTSGSDDAGEVRIDRGDGSYSPGLVAELPEGIRWMQHLAAGPAGVAALAEPGLPAGTVGADPPVRLVASKDGFELRLNEPPGGATLFDSMSQTTVLEISAEDMAAESPPAGAGFRYVEDPSAVEDPSGDIDLIVFEDPATEEVLVSFTQDEIDSAVLVPTPDSLDPGQYNIPLPTEQWIGWSADDGQSWGWQSTAEVFGVPENSDASVELAVGADFVIARVEVYQAFTGAELEGSSIPVDSPAPAQSDDDYAAEAQPARWFISALN